MSSYLTITDVTDQACHQDPGLRKHTITDWKCPGLEIFSAFCVVLFACNRCQDTLSSYIHRTRSGSHSTKCLPNLI